MNIKTCITFVLGAAVGSAVTWKVIKDKYEQIAQEEIDSVKDAYSIHKNDDTEPESTEEEKEEAENIVSDNGYVQMSFYTEPEEVKSTVADNHIIDAPYVIAPGEFGELYEYETISLTYYADHILADDMDDIIEDVENTVGEESLTHFGEYEDDSVFVRNDRLKHDYEILLDYRNYSDIVGSEE